MEDVNKPGQVRGDGVVAACDEVARFDGKIAIDRLVGESHQDQSAVRRNETSTIPPQVTSRHMVGSFGSIAESVGDSERENGVGVKVKGDGSGG